LFVGHLGDPLTLLAELDRQRQEHEETLAEYRKVEAEHFKNIQQLPTVQRFQRFTLRYGITYEGGWLSWCKDVLSELHEIAGAQAISTGKPRRGR
jgi:hypothetical protein